MKISKKQLQRVIKEEVRRMLREGFDPGKIDTIIKFLPKFEEQINQNHQYFWEESARKVGLNPASQQFKDLWRAATEQKYGESRRSQKLSDLRDPKSGIADPNLWKGTPEEFEEEFGLDYDKHFEYK